MELANLDFRQFLEIGGATGVVFNPKVKKSRGWNYEGAPGSTGVSPKENPIKHWTKKRKKK